MFNSYNCAIIPLVNYSLTNSKNKNKMSTETKTKPAKADKVVKQVNLMEMVRALMTIKGATPATFIADTVVKMNKTNNPYHEKVTKRQKSNVFINFDYTKSVNRALAKEGKDADFVASARLWGEKIPNTPLVLHKGKYYLEARFLGNEPEVEYFFENGPIVKETFAHHMPTKNTEKIKEHQGLEEEVVIRTFDCTNIRQITFGGVTYMRNDL